MTLSLLEFSSENAFAARDESKSMARSVLKRILSKEGIASVKWLELGRIGITLILIHKP